MPRLLSLLVAFSFLVLSVQAQDKIHRKGGEIIHGKVTEVGLDEIKYKLASEPDGPVYAISKDRLIKVVYANGRVESYLTALNDKELYIGQQKNAIKLNFMSPLMGYTGLTFEHSIKPGQAVEANFAIIGLGANHSLDGVYVGTGVYVDTYKRGQAGVGFGFGYKFIRTPDFINRNVHYAHLLQGGYIKPVIYFGSYGENIVVDKGGGAVVDRRHVTYGAIMMELGKQWVFGQKFLLDFYGGIGYAADNIREDPNLFSYYNNGSTAHNFSFSRFGRNPGFAANIGLRFGMLLGKKTE